MLFIRALLMAAGVLIAYSVVSQTGSAPETKIVVAAIGLLFSLFIIFIERYIQKFKISIIISATLGLIVSLVISNLIINALETTPLLIDSSLYNIVAILIISTIGYIGMAIGVQKPELLETLHLKLGKNEILSNNPKIFDTSVIIDGRIADICETGFLESELLVPKFVLQELQLIADSSDSLKRNRGRRGLDILRKMQKSIDLNITIIDDDFPKIKDVDTKLVALSQKIKGTVVTNDFNLNKVAELQGVQVLNINQLANAVKPVVLPGEVMNVHILKEGKEHGQGVAYLDDGTMVVVDNARKSIGKSAEVLVTSVLQTTAGRMIFSKLKDEVLYEVNA